MVCISRLSPKAAMAGLVYSHLYMEVAQINPSDCSKITLSNCEGVDEGNTDGVLSLNKQLDDDHRISYYHDYLQQLLLAIG